MNRATFLILACLVMTPSLAGAQESDKGNALKVMTFNLRFASPTGANNWPEIGRAHV